MAIVERFETDAEGKPVMIEGRMIEPAEGRFIFRRQAEGTPSGAYAGAIRFPAESYGYLFEQSVDGHPQLTYSHADGVSCVNYAFPAGVPRDEEAIAEELLPAEHPTDTPIPVYQNGVIPLQSLAGATGVVYLDFDGEEGPFNGWGDFDAAPSGASNAQILEVWARVAEDFSPFNINVTTDLQIYLSAPEASRQRCIVTPTTNAAPGAAGVAYFGSWTWEGDTPCWAFYVSGKASAEVISHEVGHTLGLAHDGRVADETNEAEGYYGGHGGGATGWAPIMGVGYYQNLSQWSKGEYARADQTQDDFAVMTGFNSVDFRADDAGDTAATASPLELFGTTVDDDGIVGTRTDVDAFSFTTTGGNTTLQIKPAGQGPNLDISAEIRDASDAVVASSNPVSGVDASFNLNLAAGSYILRVEGVGRGSATGDGYTDYGSLGHYAIDGTVTGGVSPDRFTVNEFPPVGTVAGTVTPDNNHGDRPLGYSITAGNTGNAFTIHPTTGTLVVANPSPLDSDLLSDGWNDPAELELTVQVTDVAQPSLNELLRVVVTVVDTGGAAPAILRHRYSFTGNASDPVGGADLTLVGGAAVTGGKLDLPGGPTRSNHAAAQGTALTALASTINDSAAITMELWFNQDAAQNWAKPFMAGVATGGDYLDITPRRGADGNVSSISIRNDGDGESNVKGGGQMPLNTEYYVAATWDQPSNSITLNIGPVGGSLTTVTAPMGNRKLADLQIGQFFLGSAVFWGDPDFDGQLDEFRIWRGALSPERIAGNFATGPNPPGDADLDGLPDAWELSFPAIAGLAALDGNRHVTGNGSGAGSGDFDGDGLSDHAEYNSGAGSTDPTDADTDNDGFPDPLERNEGSNPNDANSVPAPRLAHRYAFDSGAVDAVGFADLTVTGTASVTGGALDIPGGVPRANQANAQGAAVAEIAGTINASYGLSIETWFTQDVAQNWAKVVMAGKGSDWNYLDITPRRGTSGSVASASINNSSTESTAIGGPGGAPVASGTKYYCAAIWNSLADTLTLRIGPVGGTLSTYTTSMGGKKLSEILVNEFRIGAAVQFGDPNFDGKIDEVRIWQGVLSSARTTGNFASGPGQPAGDSDGDGLPDEWEFSFAGINTLRDLSPATDFDGDGLNDGGERAAGSSPTDNDSDDDGFTDQAEVTAGTDPVNPNSGPAGPAAILAHRYSFTGNVADSVGTAHLALGGTAGVSGGNLNLPGGARRTNHATAQGSALVELANTIRTSTALTIEGWFTQDVAQDWSKLLMLGRSSGGNYLDFTPKRGGDGVPGIAINPGNGEARVQGKLPLPTGTPCYFAATWDTTGDRLVLRTGPVGGTLQTFVSSMEGKTLAGLDINQFFIGSAVASGDTDFDGQLDELRIWKGALAHAEVADQFAAGPDEVGSTPVVRSSSMNAVGTVFTLEFSKLVEGKAYHLESSTDLQIFTPVPGSQFTAGSGTNAVPLPINRDADPKLFYRLVNGPIP